MPVKIKVDNNHIVDVIDKNWNNGLAMISSIILANCNEYCKEDTGMLIMSSLIHSRLKDGLLIWNTPYAARQYYEIQTANTSPNARATWRWCEVARKRYHKQWARQAQAIMRLYK